MRALGLNLLILTFCLSTGTFAVDALIFSPLGVSPTTLSGQPIDIDGLVAEDQERLGDVSTDTLNPQYEGNIVDRITLFSTGGFDMVWTMMTLMSGSYYLNWALAVGVPQIFIYFLQGIWAFAIILTAIKYIRGVE